MAQMQMNSRQPPKKWNWKNLITCSVLARSQVRVELPAPRRSICQSPICPLQPDNSVSGSFGRVYALRAGPRPGPGPRSSASGRPSHLATMMSGSGGLAHGRGMVATCSIPQRADHSGHRGYDCYWLGWPRHGGAPNTGIIRIRPVGLIYLVPIPIRSRMPDLWFCGSGDMNHCSLCPFQLAVNAHIDHLHVF